ncbi:hypothetical protein PTKIN_Ptkin06aG0174700 [Pterospermum kingtungense]
MHKLKLRDEASDFLCEICFYNSRGPRGEKKPALKIHHFSHKHPLNIFLLTEKYRKGGCNACCQHLRESGSFLCDGCKDFSDGFVYHCMDCPFNLDIKCAVSAASDTESTQGPKHGEKETKLVHFSHEHVLVLGNLVDKSVLCLGCDLPIFGPAYSCHDCFYTIHESCIRILPQEIVQHPFHPFHPLVAFPEYSDNRKCHVYYFEECDGHFVAHIECILSIVSSFSSTTLL